MTANGPGGEALTRTSAAGQPFPAGEAVPHALISENPGVASQRRNQVLTAG
jgi:hypothetical protein